MYEDPTPSQPCVDIQDLLCIDGDFALYEAQAEGRPVQLWVGHGPRSRVAFVERSSAWLNLAPAGLMGSDQVGHLDDGTPYRLDEQAQGLRAADLDTPLDEASILQITETLARRIGVAHEQELVHGAIGLDTLRLAQTSRGWDAALCAPAPLPDRDSAADLRDLAVLALKLKDPTAALEPASSRRFQHEGLRNLIRSCLAEDEALQPANAWAFRQLLEVTPTPARWPFLLAGGVALVTGALLLG